MRQAADSNDAPRLVEPYELGTNWTDLVEHARRLGRNPEFADLDDAQLDVQVRSISTKIAMMTAQYLALLAELVARGIWADQGAKSPGQWLSWSAGVAPSTARDQVRVAVALRQLPKIRERFEDGKISYSKVRAITRLGAEESEDLLLDLAEAGPAGHVERMVRATRSASRRAGTTMSAPDRSDPDHHPETLRWIEHRDGTVSIHLRADEADALRVLHGLRWLADHRGRDPDATHELPQAARAIAVLDSLVAEAMAKETPDASGLDRDRLVVEMTAVPREDDSAESAGIRLEPRLNVTRSPKMSATTMWRLACTAAIQPVYVEVDGTPLDVGRAERVATAKQRRALAVRDPQCRFPACRARRFLHAHHALHWEHGGATDLDNLMHLCGFHHRWVHEHGWITQPLGRGQFRFADPDGTVWGVDPDIGGDSAESLIRIEEGPPDPKSLQPRGWYGEHMDLNQVIQSIELALDRARSGRLS